MQLRSFIPAFFIAAFVCFIPLIQAQENLDKAMQEAEALIARSKEADKRNDPTEARNLIRQALAELEALPESRENKKAVYLIKKIGYTAYTHYDPETALNAWQITADFLERTLDGDDPELQKVRNDLAATLIYLDRYDAARVILEKVLEVYSRTPPPSELHLQMTRMNLAITLRVYGDYHRARELFEETVAYFEAEPNANPSQTALARLNLAQVLMTLGHRSQAMELYAKILEFYEANLPADDPAMQKVRLNLARASSNPHAAELCIREILEAYEANLPADHANILEARLELASILVETGDYFAAQALQEQVLEVYERTLPEENPNLQLARLYLGGTLHRLGDLEGARAVISQVMDTYERTLNPDSLRLQQTRNNLADIHSNLGNYKKARTLYEQTLEVYKRTLTPDHPLIREVQLSLAQTLYDLDDFENARTLLESLLVGSTGDHPRNALDLQGARQLLAGILKYFDHPEEARIHEKQALANYEKILPGHFPDLQWARANLAVTCLLTGDEEASIRLMRQTLKGVGEYIARRVRTGAVREIDQCIGKVRGFLDRCLSLQAFPMEEAFVAGEAIRTAAIRSGRTLRFLTDHGDEEIHRLRENLIRCSIELAAAPKENQLEAILKRDQAERSLGESLNRLAGAKAIQEAPDLKRMAAGLPEKWAGISFLRYDQYHFPDQPLRDDLIPCYLVFILHGDGSLERVDLGPAQPIDDAVDHWQETLCPAEGLFAEEELQRLAGKKVYQLIWAPLEKQLRGLSRVLAAPASKLAIVPLEALPHGEGVLADRYTLVFNNGLSSLAPPIQDLPQEPGTLLAMGGIDYDKVPELYVEKIHGMTEARTADFNLAALNTFRTAPQAGEKLPSLASAGLEVNEVVRIYRSSYENSPLLMQGACASRASLIAQAREAQYLHIATHGFADLPGFRSIRDIDSQRRQRTFTATQAKTVGLAPSLRCGLSLAGYNRGTQRPGAEGVLTGEEIQGLDLSRCQLAVLSTCMSHVGKENRSQGLMSLERSLAVAGVRGSITSLWNVADQACYLLFSKFYQFLWEENLGPVEALRQAKQWLRNLSAEEASEKLGDLPIAPDRGTVRRRKQRNTPRPAKKPFSHPYYWAGFVYWGAVK